MADRLIDTVDINKKKYYWQAEFGYFYLFTTHVTKLWGVRLS